jgi:hypothetical protein
MMARFCCAGRQRISVALECNARDGKVPASPGLQMHFTMHLANASDLLTLDSSSQLGVVRNWAVDCGVQVDVACLK